MKSGLNSSEKVVRKLMEIPRGKESQQFSTCFHMFYSWDLSLVWWCWLCPSWKMMELVNGKDDIPYIMENKKCSKPPTRSGCEYLLHGSMKSLKTSWVKTWFKQFHSCRNKPLKYGNHWFDPSPLETIWDFALLVEFVGSDAAWVMDHPMLSATPKLWQPMDTLRSRGS